MERKNILESIDSLLLNQRLKSSQAAFLSILREHFLKRGSLSSSQMGYLSQFVEEFDNDTLTDWDRQYQASEDFQFAFRTAIDYYLQLDSYFMNLVNEYKNSDKIPLRADFVKLTENSYVQKCIAKLKAVPTFNIGDIAKVRKNANHGHVWRSGHGLCEFGLQTVLILANDVKPDSIEGLHPKATFRYNSLICKSYKVALLKNPNVQFYCTEKVLTKSKAS